MIIKRVSFFISRGAINRTEISESTWENMYGKIYLAGDNTVLAGKKEGEKSSIMNGGFLKSLARNCHLRSLLLKLLSSFHLWPWHTGTHPRPQEKMLEITEKDRVGRKSSTGFKIKGTTNQILMHLQRFSTNVILLKAGISKEKKKGGELFRVTQIVHPVWNS